jgi:hypothetical protein
VLLFGACLSSSAIASTTACNLAAICATTVGGASSMSDARRDRIACNVRSMSPDAAASDTDSIAAHRDARP